MKQSEIKKCIMCDEGVGHNNLLLFFKVEIQSMMLDIPAISRAHGMEQMMGGGSFGSMIQQTLGRDEDLVVKTGSLNSFCICLFCATEHSLTRINEVVVEKAQEEACVDPQGSNQVS